MSERSQLGQTPARTRRAVPEYGRCDQNCPSDAIRPSCAVALFRDGELTVWTLSQGVFPLRAAIAEIVGMDQGRVRCIHAEGAGCYRHNGADDVADAAALAAIGVPGQPVRMLWTRKQEHGWEPLGPLMVVDLIG